ncbi:hypothetical protein [Moraxella catarrhalis]|uniref:Phage protein n=1 Tax=Moraxella catarrhalis TaxID=480 RepID=A0ABY0BIS2_MORCA|nr:hypothetical protein [Moraxella catarrhalis]EGE10914.1 hypothetical protein E9K_09314 [Moraxella catarrhalis 103P14B1]EGE24835.1 hypothetical protein E9Y_04321 [Moraxella catarrhalis 101P30B1]EGE26148.1 hypothetical protein E9W_01240 [Moraxella catarrhalis CO72]MDE4519212.1 hypothetical protein [Moraxella catarrhalis]MPW52089.1 hypothetical protein [Moraxella catarrhalis]
MTSSKSNCLKFWRIAKTIKPSDLIALWCNQEPYEFNVFIANTGYLPECADAKKALLLDALNDGELDYIDDGTPYNQGLWFGNPVGELLGKNRIRIDKDKAKAWIIQKHKQGDLGELPAFLMDDLEYKNFASLQDELIAKDNENLKLQTQNEQLKSRIAELERATPTNNSHTNTALIALNDVIATHWQDPSNPPKQQFIQAWIRDNYPNIEPSKALWIDKIIRHKDK